MPKKPMPAKPRLTQEEMIKKIYAREYQEAEVFKLDFQESKECKDFRKAWGIPSEGFPDYQSYERWNTKLNETTNAYIRSEQYIRDREQIQEKRKEEYEKKITRTSFEVFANHVQLRTPLFKYEFDVDQTTINSGQPVYWRHFIEKCILMSNFEVMPVRRPIPEARISWSNESFMYELIIENIFPDTTQKDFKDRGFQKKFRDLQTKLPGYKKIIPRRKKKFDYVLGVLKADAEMPDTSDTEKSDHIDGVNESEDLAGTDRKRLNRLKQTRHRLKRRGSARLR